MAITLVSTPTTAGSSVAVTTITVNKPTGLVNGDMLLWLIVGQTATSPTGQPTGFVASDWGTGTTTGLNIEAYTRFVDGTEGSTFTSQTLTSARTACIMAGYRGVDSATPHDVANSAAGVGTTTTTYNAITNVTNGAWDVGLVGESFASGVTPGTLTSSNSTTDGQGVSTAGAAINVLAGLQHNERSGTGSFLMTASNSAATTRSVAQMSSMRPAVQTTCDFTAPFTVTLAAALGRTQFPDFALAVTATLAATMDHTVPIVGADLGITATLAAAAERTQPLAATLTVTCSLAAAADVTTPNIPIDGDPLVITVNGTAGAPLTGAGGAVLAVSCSLSGTAALDRPLGATLGVTASTAGTVALTATVAAPLAVGVTLAGATDRVATVAAPLAVTFSSVPTFATPLAATLAVTFTGTAGALIPVLAASTLSVTAGLVAGGVRTQPLATSLDVVTTLVAGAARELPAGTLLTLLVGVSAGATREQPFDFTAPITVSLAGVAVKTHNIDFTLPITVNRTAFAPQFIRDILVAASVVKTHFARVLDERDAEMVGTGRSASGVSSGRYTRTIDTRDARVTE